MRRGIPCPNLTTYMFKVAMPFSDSSVADLLTSAFEGGMSRKWIRKVQMKRPAKEPSDPDKQARFYSDFAVMPGYSLRITDDETGKVYVLGRKIVETGLQNFATDEDVKHHFADFVREDYDAVTGDVFLQICLFGKVLYG